MGRNEHRLAPKLRQPAASMAAMAADAWNMHAYVIVNAPRMAIVALMYGRTFLGSAGALHATNWVCERTRSGSSMTCIQVVKLSPTTDHKP